MQALFLKNGQLEYSADADAPKPGAEEVLLRISLAGICGTDRALLSGYAGFEGIPGHEFVGVVEAAGDDVPDFWVGRRVVAEINLWCGECDYCKQGKKSHCVQRKVIGIRNHNGAFAQYLVVHHKLLHAVPDNVSDRQAVFAEPLAAAFRVVEQLQPLRYERVLVVGAGTLGQLIARALCTQGWSPYVVVRHDKQSERLANSAVHCIREDQVQDKCADVVIEASGHPSGLALALKAVRPTGAIVLKSTYMQPQTLDLSQLVVNEVQLIGSRCGPFDMALQVLKDRTVDVEPLIENVFPLSFYQEAFKAAGRRGAMKVLFQP